MKKVPAYPPVVTVRHEPVQARAAQRIEALLDAAAAVVAERGFEHLTTALVAERAGASIGTVYRYFPDRIALLVALAARNLESLRFALDREARAGHASPGATLEALFGAFVDVFRTVPSFRSVRTGDTLDLGADRIEHTAPLLIADVVAMLRELWDIELDAGERGALVRSITVVDALVSHAFMLDADGDAHTLSLALELARAQLPDRLRPSEADVEQRRGS